MPQSVPDNVIAQKVLQHLTQHGFRPPCRIQVTVRNGEVTLSGKIQYQNQRRNAVHTAHAVAGVRRVVDALQVDEHPIWGDRAKLSTPATPKPSDAEHL